MNFILPAIRTTLMWIIGILIPSISVSAVTFDIEYLDPPSSNQGFYSTSAPHENATGNPGKTLGEQRRFAFETILDRLSKTLSSSVPIHIEVRFSQMGGSLFSATIATAGPEWLTLNFPGAPEQNILYPTALANKLANKDFSDAQSGIADISMVINESIDGSALGNSTFYYGIDGQPTSSDIDFSTVVIHELLHGLGFLSVVDLFTGHKFGCDATYCKTNDYGDVYSSLIARDVNGSLKPLFDMTQQERLAAVSAEEQLVFIGDATREIATNLISGTRLNLPLVYSPSPVQVGSSLSHASNTLSPKSLMAPNYSGPLAMSKLDLAMLSDMGWGAAADLEVSLSETAAGVINITLANQGASTSGVQIIVNTSAGQFTNSSQVNCANMSSSGLNCSLDSLAAGQIVTFAVSINNAAPGTTIASEVTSDDIDIAPSNNAASIISTLDTTATSINANGTSNTTPTLSTSNTMTPQIIVRDNGGSLNPLFLLATMTLLLGRVRRSR